MYNWLCDIIGYVSESGNYNSYILQIAGFLIVMLFIVSVDVILNGLFSFFGRKK